MPTAREFFVLVEKSSFKVGVKCDSFAENRKKDKFSEKR